MTQSGFSAPARPASASVEDEDLARIEELQRHGLPDTKPEAEYDRVVELARVLFEAPISAVTLIDRDRQWFKAKVGLEAEHTPREDSFCTHAIRQDEVFVVPDAREDARFAASPLVVGPPYIRFYAGAQLRSRQGTNLGAVCVISPEPREGFSEADQRKLETLARIVSTGFELRARAEEARQEARQEVREKEDEFREAQLRIKSSLEYADLLAEVQSEDTSTEKVAAVALAAWKQHVEAGGILSSAIKSLRNRMAPADYRALLDSMPGFAI